MLSLKKLYLFEDSIDDNKLSIRIVSRNDGTYEATLKNQSGEKVGHVRVAKDDRKKLMRIEDSQVSNELQGRGIAPSAYMRLNKWAATFGYKLASDIVRSPNAEKAWKKLQASGAAQYVEDSAEQSNYYVML